MGSSAAGASHTPIGSPLQNPEGDIKGGAGMERQVYATPAPDAAAAKVQKAFAKITCSSGAFPGETTCAKSGHSFYGFAQANSGSEGHVEQPSPAADVSAESAPLHQQPAGAGMQTHVAAADASSGNNLKDSISDQGSLAAVSGVSFSQNHAANSIATDKPRPEPAGVARAVSLKGVAAADTARAFSRLRGRGSISSAAISAPVKAAAPAQPAPVAAQPPAPASKPAPPHSEPAAHGAEPAQPLAAGTLTASSPPDLRQMVSNEAGPDDSRLFDLWGQQDAGPSSSTGPGEQARAPEAPDPDKLLQSTEELLIDFFPERPAAGSNNTLASSSSQAIASNETAAAQRFGVEPAPDTGDTRATSSSGTPVPQSAFDQHLAEVGDAGERAEESAHSPRQAQEGEARMKLPHSRGDAKGASPRKRASLGRRLSGMLPGVKGKERARTPSAGKEVGLEIQWSRVQVCRALIACIKPAAHLGGHGGRMHFWDASACVACYASQTACSYRRGPCR